MSQTDIVERLRESGSQDCMRGEPWRSQVKDEAADTITQLRERLDAVAKERDQLRLSNERMREALGKIDDAGRKDGESMADTACWNPEDAHKEGWACGAHFAGRIARIALSPCRGIEIEPGVFSGCDAYLTGATDCPQCGKAALTAESGTEGQP